MYILYKSYTKKDRLSPVEFLSSYFCVPVLQCEQFTALAQWQEWHKHTKLSWRPHVHLLLLSSYCFVGKCLGYCMPSCWFGWHHMTSWPKVAFHKLWPGLLRDMEETFCGAQRESTSRNCRCRAPPAQRDPMLDVTAHVQQSCCIIVIVD